MLTTNDLKKGDLVQLRNGWQARIEDNKKGNIRLCTVYGYETEMGSVYSHDMIELVLDVIEGHTIRAVRLKIAHTDKQLQCQAMNTALFGSR